MSTISFVSASSPSTPPVAPTAAPTTASSAADSPSVVAIPSTPIFELLPGGGVVLSQQGLTTPLSASDVQALLGEVSLALQNTLSETSANTAINEQQGNSAQLKKEAQYLAELQQALASVEAAKAQQATDKASISANASLIAAKKAELASNETAIASVTGQIQSLQGQLSTLSILDPSYVVDALQLSALGSTLSGLNQTNLTLSAEIGQLTSQNAGLGADAQKQSGLIASGSAEVSEATNDIIQIAGALSAQSANQNVAQANLTSSQETNANKLILNLIDAPAALLDHDVKIAQDSEIVKNQTAAVQANQAALVLAQSVVAALAALSSIGTAGQQGIDSPQIQLVA